MYWDKYSLVELFDGQKVCLLQSIIPLYIIWTLFNGNFFTSYHWSYIKMHGFLKNEFLTISNFQG